jgi:NUMOD4 motif/HNH endonuclease
MIENWREVPGFEGRYMVSDQGRVRSLVGRRLTGLVFRQSLDGKDGYLRVTLTPVSGAQKTFKVHALVLAAFVGSKPRGCVTRHRDGVRTNNVLGNLCYGTPKENTADREQHGTAQYGVKNPNVKLTPENVLFVRNYPRRRGAVKELAKMFGVTGATISVVRNGMSWKHLN